MKKWRFLFCLLVCFLARLAYGQDSMDPLPNAVQKPTRVLFIGNSLSYSNLGVYYHIKKLGEAAVPPISVIEQHVVVPLATLFVLFAQRKAVEEIQSGHYDVVVLQETLPFTTVQDFAASCSRFVSVISPTGAQCSSCHGTLQ